MATTRQRARIVPAVLALLLATSWLWVASVPASADTEPEPEPEDVRPTESPGVSEPAAGAELSGEFVILTTVQAGTDDTITGVFARVLRDDSIEGQVVDLTFREGATVGGDSTWSVVVDPIESWTVAGEIARNGAITVQIDVHYTDADGAEQTTGWSGHDVVLAAPPPPADPSAEVIDDSPNGSVAVSWSSPRIPDLERFVVQRAGDDGSFGDVETLADPDADRFLDAPGPGTWRYRIISVRAGGALPELVAVSDDIAVDVPQPPVQDDDEDEDPPPPPPSDDGAEGPADPPADAPPSGGDGDAGDAAEQPPPNPPNEASSPSISSTSPPVAEEVEPPPPMTSDSEDFSETLPFERDEPEEITESEEVVLDPSTRRTSGISVAQSTELAIERILIPVATGLLLVVTGGHVLRYTLKS